MIKGGHKLEINIPPQQIFANCKGGLIIEGGVILTDEFTTFCGFNAERLLAVKHSAI